MGKAPNGRDASSCVSTSHHLASPGTSFYQLATDYRYNSLDQPILQRSPDGGTTAFWYDELGRLVFSQNGRQEPNDQYSFTFYDALGRITKVGQFVNLSALSQSTAGLSSSRNGWLAFSTNYREITSTYYDITPSFSSHSQTELRNRVAAITFEQADDGNAATYDAASFYAYDIHGNVNVLWQYNQDLEDLGSGQGTRVLHYYYDLVSGNVRSVAYNPNGRDRYFHRYRYDADNRITRVETWEGADWSQMGWSFNQWAATENPLESIEVWPWEEDAAYAYYDHGPLARTELGDLKVQGMDYLYTIHGWIKGINSNSLDVDRDPGRDGKDTVGNANRLVGADALSYSLHYYDGDYTPINGTSSYKAGYHVSGYGGSLVDLWNGNIAGMVTTLQDIQTHAAQPQGAQYRYDQLNRIKEMRVWQDMDVFNNQWQSSSALADYRTSYRYDANGNILNLNRNGHNIVHLGMDSLSYHYISGTNQLAYVDDAVAAGNYSVDIDDQAVGNYAYDATGNLIKDVAEEIDSIVWTAYGKVLRVVRSSGSSKPDLHFAYGPDGNRLSKKAVYGNDSTVWTFYVRDAQGNTMATYKHKESSGVLHLTDHVLYGSSRLGSHERKHVELLGAGSSPITARAGIYGLERGDKRYELSNHLGNVLAVVSDRRAKASCADTLVSGYWVDIMSTTDYYPFGMGMVERGDDGEYRYGFNGMQRDDEWQGAGNAYDFGARMYDGRLGRFSGVDPLKENFPFISNYSFAGNIPISFADDDGQGPIIRWCTSEVTNEDGTTHIHVSIEVEINIAVINQSSTALTTSEGELMTRILQKSSVSGSYKGALKPSYSAGLSDLFGLSNNDPSTRVTFDMKLTQNYRYVENANQIRNNEDILVLLDEHAPSENQNFGGRAFYDLGVASANIQGAASEEVYVSSINNVLKSDNIGNHEIGHLLGISDRYLYKDFKLVSNDPSSLMGAGKSLVMKPYDIEDIVYNALLEVKNYKLNKEAGLPTKYKLTNSGYMPKYDETPQERIDYAIDKADE